MLSVQAMIHRQEATAPLRKPAQGSSRPDSSGSGKARLKRKSNKKKRDAAAGGDDVIGDIFGDVARPLKGKGDADGAAVVAREWLLLRNTDVEQQGKAPAAPVRPAGDPDAGRRRGDPSASQVPVRRKESRSGKSKKDANGNVRTLKDPRLDEVIAPGDLPGRGSGGGGEEGSKGMQMRDAAIAADAAARLHSPQVPAEGVPVKEVVIVDKRQPPDGTRKSRPGAGESSADKKERKGGVTKGTSVKRHSSGRSTGSEGSTLRRLRGRTTQRSSAATQTPPGSHTELHKCTPAPDNRRGSYRSHDGSGSHGTDHRVQEEPPKRDISVGIPGASLLLKLVMPREKRLSRNSGGSPSRDVPPSTSPAVSRPPASPPMPWFWPPLRHVEAANPALPVPPLTPQVARGVAVGGGEAVAVGGGWSPMRERVVPFPPRAAPPVPRQVQGDQLSVSSMNSSLAGHTYEQVNFVIEPPISEGRENEYELDATGGRRQTFPPNASERAPVREISPELLRPSGPQWHDSAQRPRRRASEGQRRDPSPGSARRPSDGQWRGSPESSGRRPSDIQCQDSPQGSTKRRPSSKRKRKKSRSAATTTDDSLAVVGTIQQDRIVKQDSAERLGRRRSLEEVARTPALSHGRRRSSSSILSEERRASAASLKSNVLRGTHTLTIEKPFTVVVSEESLQVTNSVSVSLPLYHEASCDDASTPCEAPPTAPTVTKDVKIIHKLLNIVNKDEAAALGSRHNPRRRGVYVPLDPETDTEMRSDPETFPEREGSSEFQALDQDSSSSSYVRYTVTPQPSDSFVDHESSSYSCLEMESSLEQYVPRGTERRGSVQSFFLREGTPHSYAGRENTPPSCLGERQASSLYAKRLGASEPYLNRQGSPKLLDLKEVPATQVTSEEGEGEERNLQGMSLEEKVESLEAAAGRRSWDRGDQLLCPVHGTAIPYQVGALQRRRNRRASLPAQVIPEPRPSLLQRIRRSLKRNKPPDVLPDEFPPALLFERRFSESLPPPPVIESPSLPGVACSCPDPVEDFRRFRPRVGSVVSAVSSDEEEDTTQRPPTPQDGCERWRLEGEVCRLQEALGQRLGTPAMMVRRRDHRLHTINTIEKTIQRLQQDAVRNQNNQNLQDQQRVSSPVEHPSDIMDAVNANQLPDEDGTTEDISEIRELDSLQSDTLTLHSTDGGGPGKGRPSGSSQDSDKPECPRETLFQPHQIPAGKMPPAIEAVLRGTWPFEKALWHSSPASMGVSFKNNNQEVPGIMATSSVTNRRAQSTQQLLTNKVEMVYGLLSMFSSSDRDDMSRTLLAMSSSPDSCVAMRQSGCLPLLIQLLHGCDGDVPPTRETRLRAAQALHNIVHSHPDDKRGRREARVLRLLEQIRDYSDYLYERLERTSAGRGPLLEDDMDRHPCPAMAALMKLSFDEDHRHAMCSLGGLHAIAELIRRDHDGHGSTTSDQYCITLRRYAGMALTNLTFGDGNNKALLCSFRSFLRALVSQLHSPSEDLRQVTASVLRNLSWRADGGSKASLRDVGAVSILMQAALSARKESTLKVILSAVWNLSAHCSINKAEICAVDGALAFICSTLTYKSQSKTLAIVENGGGILRNISSHIAVREDLRQVLREHNTLSILLGQLRSPSLTVVSNACGTLWNLSARCSQDQRTLWELGAVPMLRSLINSKHKMISMGSSAALKNLLQARPEGMSLTDPRHGMGLPSLQARKQKALEQELDPSLSETCDNIETSPRASPTHPQGTDPHFYGQPGDGPQYYPGARPMFHSLGAQYSNVLRSESRDSISSTHSDNSHDRMRQLLMRHQAGREPPVENGRPLDGRPLDLSLRSMAPPSHGVPDIARMSQDELQRHLDSQEFTGSADEIFASRVRNMKDIYGHPPGDSAQFPESNTGSTGSIPRNGAFHGQGPQPPYSPSTSRRCSSGTSDEERSGTGRSFVNGQQPHNEAHYNIYSKYVNFSRNLAEVNIENEDQEEPLNYSLNYNGRIPSKPSTNDTIANIPKTTERPEPQIDNYVGERREARKTEAHKEKDRDQEDFTGYTETDLDQPTNFSLRYSEERDSDEAALYRRPPKAPQETPSQFFEPSIHDDSVKTYCTEGTPYETPYNFSTATSMTDLREPAIKEEIEREKSVSPGEEKKEKDLKVDDLENIEDSDDARDTLEPLPSETGIPIKSGLSSGMMTPDKPITYCVEGTPVCLSRFSSVSSLTSGEINANNERDGLLGELSEDGEQKPQLASQEKSGRLQEQVQREAEQVDTVRDGSHTPSSQQLDRPEGKSVHYEETPLMFSRATSVSSLSSFEVHSIHDDRSSVVSDFSRFTSGAISPSDLPDSPSQTVPPSPKRSRPPSQPFKQPPTHKPRASTGVFSEAPKAWVEEGTPVEFSRATSLSSLTIDDELPITVDVVPRDRLRGDGKDSSENTASEGSRAASRGSQRGRQIPCTNIPRFQSPKHEQLETEGRGVDEADVKKEDEVEVRSREHSETRSSTHSDSESENILAECISSGMPTSTQRSKQYSGRGPSRIGRPAAAATPRSGIPVVKAANLPTQIPSGPAHAQQGIGGGVWGGDTLRTYCTEDTPASVSHAASISDLSQLSIPGEDSTKDMHVPGLRPSLNDSGDNSSDNDNLLEQCIQSAMPKARPGAKVKEVKIPPKRHGTGHLCSHGVPPPAAPVLASPRRSPHHRPVPVARVTPAVKVAGTRVSPHPPTGMEDVSKDQVRMWATEGTPATFSRADSLSSLSCEDEMNRASRDPSPRTPQSPRSRTPQSPQPQVQTARPRTPPSPRMRRSRQQQHLQQRGQDMVEEDEEVPKRFAVEGTPGVISRHSSLSSLEGDSPVIQPQNAPQAAGVHKYGVEDTPVCFSRNSSLSSLSVDSYGEETTPTEQALLQQCISQGMPKSKSDTEGGRRKRRGGSRIPAPSSRSPARLVPGVPMQRLTLCRDQQSSPSKNVETMAAAVEDLETDAVMYTPDAESSKLRTDSEQSEKNERAYRHVEEEEVEDEEEEEEEESQTDHTEIESIKTTTTAEICDPKSEVTSEGSGATVVVQSLRREEKSPVEIEEEQRVSEECVEGSGSSPEEKHSWEEQRRSGDKSSPSEGRGSDTSVTASMSESGLIAVEAMKVARAVAGEAKLLSSDETSHMSQSVASAASDVCIDNIKPPSAMGSLASMSNSLTSSAEERLPRTGNRRLECRHTRRVPEMVRRALGEQDYGSNENMASMASSCHSNLDNIPPPSMLDDDMENSMISVASITSEVAEQRESPPSPPVDHTTQVAAPARQLAAVFRQEAMNAASTLTLTGGDEASTYQEITDITEHEDTVGPPSDTELAADDLPSDIPDLPQDGFSSTSSPHRLGTPRARRHQMKDRYRTFTRGDGEVSSDATPSQDTDPTLVEVLPSSPSVTRTPKQRRQDDSERFRTRTISTDSTLTNTPSDMGSIEVEKEKVSPRKSPKERRQMDPSRFQTHTISDSPPVAELTQEVAAMKIEDLEAPQSPPKLQGKQSFKQRRQEDRERYQTRTIDVPLSDITPDAEAQAVADEDKEGDGTLVDFQDSNEMLDLTAEQLEALQQDANIVICTLNETREAMTSESSDLLSEENIIDIETLSLISNEDELDLKNFLRDIGDEPPDKEDDLEDEDEEEEEEEVQQILRRPRIVKPGEETARPVEEEDGAGKGIRGRRKPLYSSARKYNATPAKPTTTSTSPARIIPARTTPARPSSSSPVKPSSPKLPRATRASALRQTSNIQRGGSSGEESPTGRATGSSAGSSAGSSPRLGPAGRGTVTRPARSKSLARPGPDPPRPLRRQNTFTKDDSDTPPSPERTVQMESKKASTPARGLSKPRIRRDTVQPSPTVRATIPKSGSQDLSPTKGRPPQSKSTSLTRDARPPTSSDMAEWRPDSAKKTVKKEVTSRIANLWKKVERAQAKPKDDKKDSRVWISRPKSAAKETPPRPLVRSSTYEKLPGVGSSSSSSDTGKSRTRLGLKLAKLRGRDTRSSPPSEATTPVDSRPHCLVSPTRSRMAEVHVRHSETVQLRQRPATHPPAGGGGGQGEEDSEARAKRLSRLGSFIVVEEDGRVRSPPQSAIVPPFNYQPPVAPRARSAVATRIPQPSKSLLSNAPCARDDNGNAADPSVVTGAWRP